MQRGFLREHYWMTGILQRLADSGAVFLSALMALWICSKLFADYQLDYSKYSILIFLSIVLSILVFSRFDIYRSWRGISKGREIRILIAAWASVFAILACVSFATKTGDQYSRIWVSMWLLIGCCFLVLSRVVQRYFVDWLRSNGFNQRHIVIVGEGEKVDLLRAARRVRRPCQPLAPRERVDQARLADVGASRERDLGLADKRQLRHIGNAAHEQARLREQHPPRLDRRRVVRRRPVVGRRPVMKMCSDHVRAAPRPGSCSTKGWFQAPEPNDSAEPG